MKYKLDIDDVFEYLGNDYVTIDKIDYEKRRFFLTNKLVNETKPTKEFVIFEALPEGLIVSNPTDKDIENVCSIFSEKMTDRINKLKSGDDK